MCTFLEPSPDTLGQTDTVHGLLEEKEPQEEAALTGHLERPWQSPDARRGCVWGLAPWKRETGKRAACLPPVPPGVDPFPVRTWPGLGPTCFSASPRMKAEDPVGTTLWECTLGGGGWAGDRSPAAEPFPCGFEGVLVVTASAGDLPF